MSVYIPPPSKIPVIDPRTPPSEVQSGLRVLLATLSERLKSGNCVIHLHPHYGRMLPVYEPNIFDQDDGPDPWVIGKIWGIPVRVDPDFTNFEDVRIVYSPTSEDRFIVPNSLRRWVS